MSLNRRYIASLAGAAVLTLVIGYAVKQRLRVETTASAAPSEASPLQLLSQEGQVRRLSSYLDERVRAVGAFVVYVPETRASGLRWRTADTLVTTVPDEPVVATRSVDGDTTRVAPLATSDSLRGQWALVVGRRPDGSIISTAGLVGGRANTTCGAAEVSEYVIAAPIHEELAGAGIFDLDGRVRGLVVHCGGRLAAVPASTVLRLMADGTARRDIDVPSLGVQASPLDDVARSYFGVDSGLLVTRVVRESAADRAGWVPGDVIVAIDETAVGPATTRGIFEGLVAQDSAVVTLVRGNRRVATRLRRSTSDTSVAPTVSIGLTLAGQRAGVPIDQVSPGSLAEAAGLRPGDRLRRVGSEVVTTTTAAQRALDRVTRASQPTFLVFERDTLRLGAFVRP